MFEYTLPSIPENFEIILEWLKELGYITIKNGHFAPISFEDLVFWQQAMGFKLDNWELLLLHKLSTVYIITMKLCSEPNYEPPMEYALNDEHHSRIRQRFFGK